MFSKTSANFIYHRTVSSFLLPSMFSTAGKFSHPTSQLETKDNRGLKGCGGERGGGEA